MQQYFQKNCCKNFRLINQCVVVGRAPQRLLHGAVSVNSAQEPFVEGFLRTPSAKFCLSQLIRPGLARTDTSVSSQFSKRQTLLQELCCSGRTKSQYFRQIETKSSLHSRLQLASPRTRVYSLEIILITSQFFPLKVIVVLKHQSLS